MESVSQLLKKQKVKYVIHLGYMCALQIFSFSHLTYMLKQKIYNCKKYIGIISPH